MSEHTRVPSATSPVTAPLGLDATRVKRDFPALERIVNGHLITYLDSAASSQRPWAVLKAMDRYYETTHANVHRGVYTTAVEATERYEGARSIFARFVNACSTNEIIFTKNVTEALNLVAQSWGNANVHAGDVIVYTEMEHHANLVPWQMLAARTGAVLRYVPITDDGQLDLSDLDALLDGAKVFAFTAASNVLGTLNPVRQLADAAHKAGAIAVCDAAQLAPHMTMDVAAMGVDFAGITGHKMCGPTGVGVLWGREALLDAMPPFLGGGDMINDVRIDGFTPNELPWKFEAGTPPIAEVIGLGAACDYLSELSLDEVRTHEIDLTGYAMDLLEARFGDRLTIHGPRDPVARMGVLSMALSGVHPHDISQVLDQQGVCVRASHHCAKPLMRRLGVGATARASFYVYTERHDVDTLAQALGAASDFFN